MTNVRTIHGAEIDADSGVNLPTKIDLRAVAELLPYARNSRTHSPAQVEHLAGLIRRFGWTNPCIVADGVLLAGHGRIMAAQKLGLARVPCIDLSHLSDNDRRAYVIADNRSSEMSGWDLDMLKLETDDLREAGFDLEATVGFSEDTLAEMFADLDPGDVDSEGGDPDAVPDVPEDPVSQVGDIWVCGPHRIACGDCSDMALIDGLMQGEVADLCVTDPPYNVAYESKLAGSIKNDNMADAEFRRMLRGWYDTMFSVMKPGAPIYVYFSWMRAVPFLKAFFDNGFKFQTVLLWKKSSFVLSRSDHHYITEPAIYGWAPGAGHKWFGGRKQHNVFDLGVSSPFQKQDDGRVALVHGDCAYAFHPDALIDEVPADVFSVPRPQRSELHPTQKPVELCRKHLRNSALPGDLVVDAFGGSGSTALAAHMERMRSRLMELDPKYVDVIVRRLEMFTGKRAVHAMTGEVFPREGEVRAEAVVSDPIEDDGEPF